MLEITSVCKSFDGKVVLDNLNLTIREGEIVSLLGESGSGKSTILNLLMGIIYPDKGDILWDGRELSNTETRLRNFGIVFQSGNLFPNLTVEKNISYGMRGYSKEEMRSRVKELLDLVSLANFEKRSLSSLSGGQRQRIAIARALATNPKALFLDESFSSLDPGLRAQLRLEIRELIKKLKIPCLLVTHDKNEASAFSDRVAILNKGKIEQIDNPQKLFSMPTSAYICDFFGHGNYILDSGKCSFFENVKIVGDSETQAKVISRDFCEGKYSYKLKLSECGSVFKTVLSKNYFEINESVFIDKGDVTHTCDITH